MMRIPLVLALALTLSVSACRVPNPYTPPTQPQPVPGGAPPDLPPGEPLPPAESFPVPEPVPEPTPSAREYQLGSASRSLVNQAHTHMAAGNFAVAAGSIERALRIEPNNPLLWIELGRVRQAEGNYAQAENLGRKALSLATGDPRTQSSAWYLIAESLRARGRAPEAREAEARAEELAFR